MNILIKFLLITFFLSSISFAKSANICPNFSVDTKKEPKILKELLKTTRPAWKIEKVTSCLDIQSFSFFEQNTTAPLLQSAKLSNKEFGNLYINLLIQEDNTTIINTARSVIDEVENETYFYRLNEHTKGTLDDYEILQVGLTYKNIPLKEILDIYISDKTKIIISHPRMPKVGIESFNFNLRGAKPSLDLVTWASQNLNLRNFKDPMIDEAAIERQLEAEEEQQRLENIIRRMNEKARLEATDVSKKIKAIQKELQQFQAQ